MGLGKENGIRGTSRIPFFVDIARFFGLFWDFDSLTNFCVLHENTRESVNDSVNKNATENMLFKAGTIIKNKNCIQSFKSCV